MQAGIIGLPLVGKTTIFNVLTHARADTTIGAKKEPNVGVVRVPDLRVDFLASLYLPKKTTHATIEFVDVQGVVRGKSQEVVLAPLRAVDALVHVVREFEDAALPHADGSIDPERDITNVDMELILADLGSIEKRLDRLERDLKKARNPQLEREKSLLDRAKAWLEESRPLREMEFTVDEKQALKGFAFLSSKPMIYVMNLGETDLERLRNPSMPPARPNTEWAMVSGKLEAEMAELAPEELQVFLADYGMKESGAERLIRVAYHLLGLISFLTAGEEECRAWTITRGMTAHRAAGAIHSDIETHFIRAEVVHFDDFKAQGNMHAAREKGLLRLEGKDYVVRDGDIITFRHSG